MDNDSAPPATDCQRLDKWLWAARFYKTRGLAVEAINGGKVHVDGQRVKPARALRRGSQVRIRKGALEFTIVVLGLAKQRGPASEAMHLYRETEESASRRQALAEERRLAPTSQPRGSGRPNKRDRRRLGRAFRR